MNLLQTDDQVVWKRPEGTVYQFRVLLCPEEDGGFSAHVMNLPGIVSQGETEEEALYNVRDALTQAIDYYKSESKAIPWGDAGAEKIHGSMERWILVDG